MLSLGPALGRLLVTLFGGLFAYIAKYFVVEKSFRVVAIGILLGLVAVIVAGFQSCAGEGGSCSIALVNAANQYPTFAMGLGIAFNTTTYAAGASYLLIWSACQLYVLKKRMTGMLLGGG